MRTNGLRTTIRQLKRSLLLCTMATLLTTLLTCCATVKPEYIPFPEFPVLSQVTKNADGTVSMPSSDLIRLAEFKLKYDTLKDIYGQKTEKVK